MAEIIRVKVDGDAADGRTVLKVRMSSSAKPVVQLKINGDVIEKEIEFGVMPATPEGADE